MSKLQQLTTNRLSSCGFIPSFGAKTSIQGMPSTEIGSLEPQGGHRIGPDSSDCRIRRTECNRHQCIIGGTLSATFLAVFFVPLFFVTVLRPFRVKLKEERTAGAEAAAVPAM